MLTRGWLRRFAILASLGLLEAAAPGTTRVEARPPQGDRQPHRREVPHDQFGRPVLDEWGGRVNYPADPTREDRGDGAPPPRREAAAPASAGPTSGGPALEWYRASFGAGIGRSGLNLADLDGDGTPEIVAAAAYDFWPNRYFYVIGRQGTGYTPRVVGPWLEDNILSLRVVDLFGARRILVGAGSEIREYDPTSLDLERTISTGASAILGLTVADLDGDGAPEIVFCDADALYIHDAATGAAEYTASGLGGFDLGVGNVDADAALEIVVSNRFDPGFVIDGGTRGIEWTNPSGFGEIVRLADLDGDGRSEIVAGSDRNGIEVFDAVLRAVEWEVDVELDLGALRILDVEGDGILDIVYGNGQWGQIHVVDTVTRTEKRAYPNPDHGVTDIAVGDVDGDGALELLWGAGQSSTGPDHLYVVDADSGAVEWTSTDISGPFYALSHGDVDADGEPELLHGSLESDSGYGDGLFYVHDARTKTLEYESPEPTGLAWNGLWRIANANLDADPQQEIVITTSYLYDGMLICYDGLTHAEQWRAVVPSGLAFHSLRIADVDADSTLEVVAGTYARNTAAPGSFVYVFDGFSGALEWRSPDLGGIGPNLSLLRVATLSPGGNPQILVGDRHSSSGSLVRIDGVTRVVKDLGDYQITALDTPDRDGDAVAELIIGTAQGRLLQLDPDTGQILDTLAEEEAPIAGLAFADVNRDGEADWAFASDNQVFLHSGAGGGRLWASEPVGTHPSGQSVVGEQDSLLLADIDGDGRTELVVNVGRVGFRIYEFRPGLSVRQTDSQDPVFSYGQLTYEIEVSNGALEDATGVTLTDDLPAGVTFVSATPSQGTCAQAGGAVTCQLGTIAGRQTATVALDVLVGPGEGILTNIASVSGNEADDVPQDNVSVERTSVIRRDLTVLGAVGRERRAPIVNFTIVLSSVSKVPVTVDYATSDGTAVAGQDYVAATGRLTFAPGTRRGHVRVRILSDRIREGREVFHFDLSQAVGAGMARSHATGTILDP